MSTRRTSPGGWVKRRRIPCRWCGGEVPKRRVTFCSAACVHHWKLRTDPGYLREQVFERDRGVCGLCGIDTEALRKDCPGYDSGECRQPEYLSQMLHRMTSLLDQAYRNNALNP